MTGRSLSSRRITLKDIAQACDVSVWTVSSALRGDARVKPETAARVLETAERLGYNPAQNETARRLAMMRGGNDARYLNHTVAVFLPRHYYQYTYFNLLCQGVMETLNHAGFNVLVTFLYGAIPTIMARGEVDGVILYGQVDPVTETIAQLQQCPGFGRRPIISMIDPGLHVPAAYTDDERGAYLATRHLLDLGHRHIAHFFHPWFTGFPQMRYDGMCAALRKEGLDPEHHLHFLDLLPLDNPAADTISPKERASIEDTGAHPLVHYLRDHPEVTAMIARNDRTAYRAWLILQRAGWRLPDDFSIIGFDDTDPIRDAQGNNILTTVRLPLVEVGHHAAQLLIDRLADQTLPMEHVMLPTELIIRGTTTPARP